jgi:release factor glutamine methyltransferase
MPARHSPGPNALRPPCRDEAAPVGQGARFDLILSNPPYIRSGDIPGLMPEVSRYEPVSALDGGSDGLDAYRRIIPILRDRLTHAGVAVLEIGIDQAASVCDLAAAAGLHAETRPDLAGIPRAVVIRRAA